MPRKVRNVTLEDLGDLHQAVTMLKAAHTLLKKAGAKTAAKAAYRAFKSADGAVRHANGVFNRQVAADHTRRREWLQARGWREYKNSKALREICGDTWGIAHEPTISGRESHNDSVYETWDACWDEVGEDAVAEARAGL